MSLAEKYAYSGDQGRPGIFVGGEVGAKLRKCLQIIWITHGYDDDAPG